MDCFNLKYYMLQSIVTADFDIFVDEYEECYSLQTTVTKYMFMEWDKKKFCLANNFRLSMLFSPNEKLYNTLYTTFHYCNAGRCIAPRASCLKRFNLTALKSLYITEAEACIA